MPKFTAKTADKHVLYQLAVQTPDVEVDFFTDAYKERYGKAPTLFKEDFCGTALISCDFVKRNKKNHSYGVDLHKPTLDWARKHNLSSLPEKARSRVHLIQDNVKHVKDPKVHVIAALNFSYFIFKERKDLVAYYRCARESIAKEGMFILDAYGGWEAQQVIQEKTRNKGFTYIWDQASYNPINDHTLCHIHFKFPDGTKMDKAFSYDWRLWTLGDIQDALRDAGFSKTEVYWDHSTNKKDEDYRVSKTAENTPGWVAYIVAWP